MNESVDDRLQQALKKLDALPHAWPVTKGPASSATLKTQLPIEIRKVTLRLPVHRLDDFMFSLELQREAADPAFTISTLLDTVRKYYTVR